MTLRKTSQINSFFPGRCGRVHSRERPHPLVDLFAPFSHGADGRSASLFLSAHVDGIHTDGGTARRRVDLHPE